LTPVRVIAENFIHSPLNGRKRKRKEKAASAYAGTANTFLDIPYYLSLLRNR